MTKGFGSLVLAGMLGFALWGLSATQAEGQSLDYTSTDTHLFSFHRVPQAFAARVEALGGEVAWSAPEVGIVAVSGLSDRDAARIAGRIPFARDLTVQWIPEPHSLSVQGAVDAATHAPGVDPTTSAFFPCQWNMTQIDAPGAWAQDQLGDPNIKVAVLDTGADPNHQDLAGRIDLVQSASALTPGSSPCGLADDLTIDDFNFHGSFVTGIVTSNGLGVAGIAPLSQVVAVKVLNCSGSGSFSDVILGILYAASLPDVDVINMSFLASVPKNAPGAGFLLGLLNQVINFAVRQGKLPASAAGNDARDLDHDGNLVGLPGQAGAGIAAWAGDIDGNLASYSNFGTSATWVGAGGGDFTPGSPLLPLAGCGIPPALQGGLISVCASHSIFAACPGGVFYLGGVGGTSFSVAHVSGVAALVDGKHGGRKSGNQLKTILSRTADDIGPRGVDSFFSHGRVNASEAVTK
jgi:subtilisin family serine protease